jgi:hypothetical protein
VRERFEDCQIKPLSLFRLLLESLLAWYVYSIDCATYIFNSPENGICFFVCLFCVKPESVLVYHLENQTPVKPFYPLNINVEESAM